MPKSKMTYRSLVLGAVFFILHACGLAQQTNPPAATGDQQGASAPNIRSGAGDFLNIVVFDTPELTTSARVSQDGEVNLPVLGMMKLAGLNTIAAARTMQDELGSRHFLLYP